MPVVAPVAVGFSPEEISSLHRFCYSSRGTALGAFLAWGVVLAMVALGGAACGSKTAAKGGYGSPCETVAECAAGLACFQGMCQIPGQATPCTGDRDCTAGQVCRQSRCVTPDPGDGGDQDTLGDDETGSDTDDQPETPDGVAFRPGRLDFGALAITESKTLEFFIINLGSTPFSVIGATPGEDLTTGGSPSEWTFAPLEGSFPIEVPGGGEMGFSATFTSQFEVAHEGYVHVALSGASSTEVLIPAITSVKGEGVLKCTPPRVELGPTGVNQRASQLFNCENTGTAPVVVSSLRVVPTPRSGVADPTWELEGVYLDPGRGAVTIQPPFTIGPRQTLSFRASAISAELGDFSATGLITPTEGADTQAPLLLRVVENPQLGRILCPEQATLPPVPVGETLTQRMNCRNAGDAPLTVNSFNISSPPNSQFGARAAAGVVPFTVPPGDTFGIDLSFVGTAPGRYETVLNIGSNDPRSPTTPVRLHATATPLRTGPCQMVCDPVRLDFGRVPPGQTRTLNVGCRNEGGENLVIREVTQPSNPAFRILHPPTPAIIPSLSTFAVIVRFTPPGPAPQTSGFKITNDGTCPDALTAEIELQGALGVEPIWPDCTPPNTFRTALRWERKTFTTFPTWLKVWSSPLVANMTDDNGDGRIDEDDQPDVIITSTETINRPVDFNNFDKINDPTPSIIRVLSGNDGRELVTMGMAPEHHVSSLPTMLVADIDLDNKPEIVGVKFEIHPGCCHSALEALFQAQGQECPQNQKLACKFQTGRLIAFEHDGTFKWVSDPWQGERDDMEDMSFVGAADLDGDGVPELYRGSTVWTNDGRLKWNGSRGVGRTLGHGCATTAVDLDKDDKLELVACGMIYRHDGSIYADLGASPGNPAAADLDGDGYLEVVLMSGGTASIVDWRGNFLVRDQRIQTEECQENNEGGVGAVEPGMIPTAPTIADFTGDGLPEIAFQVETHIKVMRWRGGNQMQLVWQAAIQDCTGASNPTAFDFEGDGIWEVVVNDEPSIKIFRGRDGRKIFEAERASVTGAEIAAIADVTKDGHAEVVVVMNDGFPGFTGYGGVRVYGSQNNDWVGTASIWPSFDYHYTNFTGNALIASPQEPFWLGRWKTEYNAFRAALPFCKRRQ